MANNWWEELSFYLGKKLPIDDGPELERLIVKLGIPQTELWLDTGTSKILDQNKAHERIHETLKFRWGGRVSLIGAVVSIAGAIASWLPSLVL